MLTNWFTFLLHRFLKVCDPFSTISIQTILTMCYVKSLWLTSILFATRFWRADVFDRLTHRKAR